MLQSKFSLFEIEGLKGDVEFPENPFFNKEMWITGEYQEKQEKFVNAMFGFRNTCIRINNQIDFSLFNKANAKDVVVGMDNYLFEVNYIRSYTGEDFLGKDSISHTLQRMKFLSDTLKKLNKDLIIAFAPGKAFYYPEYIPEEFLIRKKDMTNYKMFTEGAKELGLNVIDYNKWLLENKEKSKYPLYPQHGIHWSVYAAALASDSLIKKIEYLRNIDAPNLRFETVRLEQAQESDYDCADGMNLFFRLKSFNLAYPNLLPTDTVGKVKPKVLVVSDSFYWVMYSLGISNSFDRNHRIWYYNKQAYPESFNSELLVNKLNFSEEIGKYDVVVIMATDNNLRNISWGFLEKAEMEFKYKNKSTDLVTSKDYLKQVNDFIAYIKMQPKWVDDAKKRAREKQISLDSMLVLEAIWQVDHPAK